MSMDVEKLNDFIKSRIPKRSPVVPVHKVKGGYRWGSKGKVFSSSKEAERQGRAAYAHGYKGRKASKKK